VPDRGMWYMKKSVLCVETGEVFDSLREAGTWIGHDYPRKDNRGGSFAGSHISHAVNLPNRTAGGFHWRLVQTHQNQKEFLLNTAPADEVLEFMFPETKESVITQRTVSHKTRNKPLYTMLKELYNYTCQVEGCNETEVEVAHIYKHSLPDSVDNETNTWCLCRNHHRAYDANRMIFNPALNGRFIRYDVFNKVYEIGRIIYDEKHVIDVKWIKKSRDFHDSKK